MLLGLPISPIAQAQEISCASCITIVCQHTRGTAYLGNASPPGLREEFFYLPQNNPHHPLPSFQACPGDMRGNQQPVGILHLAGRIISRHWLRA